MEFSSIVIAIILIGVVVLVYLTFKDKKSLDLNNDGKVDAKDAEVAVKEVAKTAKTAAKKVATKAKAATKKTK